MYGIDIGPIYDPIEGYYSIYIYIYGVSWMIEYL